MTTLEEVPSSNDTHREPGGPENDPNHAVKGINNTVMNEGVETLPPAAVDVTTPAKKIPEQPVSPAAPNTPITPKTPMTQEGVRYRTLFGQLKKRYKELQEELVQLISVQEKDEAEKKELRDLVAAFKRQNEHLVHQCSELKAEKQSEVKLTRRISEEDFKTKSKSKKVKAEEEDLKCENPNCVNTNEDTLIKCHACGKWICETCSEARITKLKPIMKNCGTLFFACRNCVASAGEAGIAVECTPAPVGENIDGGDIKTPSELVSSMKVLLKDHVSQIEDKMDKMIEQKLAQRVPVVVTDETTTHHQPKPANGLLKVPEELRKIMLDAKNDDKVEENEKAKRAINFIIHGAEEIGDDAESMKTNDKEYIVDILKHLGLASKPVSVIRIGDSKKIKV